MQIVHDFAFIDEQFGHVSDQIERTAAVVAQIDDESGHAVGMNIAHGVFEFFRKRVGQKAGNLNVADFLVTLCERSVGKLLTVDNAFLQIKIVQNAVPFDRESG